MKCLTNKIRYDSREEAERKIGGRVRRCYFCSTCLGFHLTHKSRPTHAQRKLQRF